MSDIVSEICLYVHKAMEGASNELFVQGSHWPPTTVYKWITYFRSTFTGTQYRIKRVSA